MENWLINYFPLLAFILLSVIMHRYIGKKEAQVLHHLQELPKCIHAKVDGKWKGSYGLARRWTWFKDVDVYFTPDSIFCAPDTRGGVFCQYYFEWKTKKPVEQVVWNKRQFIPISSIRLDKNNLVIEGTSIYKRHHSLTLKDVTNLPEFEQLAKWLEIDQSPISSL